MCLVRKPLSLAAICLIAALLLPVAMGTGALAETDSKEAKMYDLPIGLTDEERTRLDEIGINQEITAPPAGSVRELAEWEPITGVLVRYYTSFGLPYEVLREYAEDLTLHVLCVASRQTNCWNSLESNGVNMANVDLIDIETNSMWTRDYGPQVQFANGVWGISDFTYNRPRPLDDLVPSELATLWGCSLYGSDLVFTGGNFLTDGHGNAFSTDLIWDENPGMSHVEVAQELEDYLGITNFVVVDDVYTSGIHHIDCWAKILNEETILVHQVDPSNPAYDELEARAAYLGTLTNCYGRPYNIVRVYCGSIGGGEVAAYSNSLILNNKVFVPMYDISSDAAALATYEAAMPGYEVFGFEGSWLSDDAIHCRGMEIHDRYMLVVDTNPLQDRQYNDSDYRVTAFVDDRSEAGLVADSLIVYWRLEGSPDFNAVVMNSTADPDSYYADIPQQASLVDVEYYVFAKDNTGRRETRPMVAPDAWYTFNTGLSVGPPECRVQPDSLDFGTVYLGYSQDTTFTITNIGGGTLNGDVSESCDHYSIVSGSGPFALAAGQSVVVTVRFEPASLGTHSCTVETGEAICADVYCTGEADNPPVCSVVPASLDFGDVLLGSFEDTAFTITNTGGGTLSGDVSESCDHYSLVSGGGHYDLTGGQFVTVTVRFEPMSAGTHNCSIETGQAACSDVSCTGVGQLDYASLPYTTGFESGSLDPYWLTQSTNDGRVRVLSSNGPHSGSYHMVMDDASSGGYSQTEAWLLVDLAGMTDVDLDFWWKDFGDETHSEDGVYFSDDGGAGFVKVLDLNGADYTDNTWNSFNLAVDELAQTAGLSLTGTFVIKFQQYDNYPITNDGFAFDDISVTETAPPACLVDPTTLDFGTVTLGEYGEDTFIITNTGGGTLTGDVSESCDHYEITSGGGAYSLAAAESVVVTVRFEPTAAGTHPCTVGTGTACSGVVCTGVGELPPACLVNPTTLDFGTVTLGEYGEDTFIITNTGGGTLTGDVTESCDHYEITSGGGAYSLAAAESVVVTVRFEPTAAGTHPCTVGTGTACSDVGCTGVGELPPACLVNPTTLDFGTVTLGEYGEDTFIITNTGGGTLTGDVTEACDHYEITSGGGAYSLAAAESVVVTVRFEPTAAGTHPCTVGTGTACSDVGCTGVGELPPACLVDPTTLDFGTVTLGEHGEDTFIITNTGGGTLTGDVTESCDHYEITSGGGAYSLAAAESVVVTVRFEPTAAGTHPCTVGTGTACSDVGCTGVGELPAACLVDPTTLDFGTVTLGEYGEDTFIITNTGGGTLAGDVTEACDQYEITSGGGAYSLAAAESVVVTMRFEPTAAGTHPCTVGTGTACSDVGCTGVGELPPACLVDPTTLDFGTVTLGEYGEDTFVITNTGGGTLTGDVSESCDHYEITSGGGAYSLAAAESVVVTVRFEPTAAGTYPCTVGTGTACSDVGCTGVGELPPACLVDPTTLDFGTVTLGEYGEDTFIITNTGGGTLAGDVTESCDHYEITSGGGAYSLAATESVVVTVRFEPAAAGTHPCTVGTGTACSDVACTGVGELPPACLVDPTTLDFGTVTLGEYGEDTFIITNTGGGTLTGDVSESCDHYAITSGGGAYSLAAAESVVVTVRFEPTAAGALPCSVSTGTACSDVACIGVGDDLAGISDRKIPDVFGLAQNSPNPFTQTTEIRYQLPVDCQVRLTIYDLLGRKVKTLVNGTQSAGYKTAHWDCRNDQGRELPSGIYMYMLRSGSYVETKKMVLMK